MSNQIRKENAKNNLIRLLTNENYTLLSDYSGNRTKVQVKCPKNHIYFIAPYSFTSNGRRCSICSGNCPIEAKNKFINLLNELNYKLTSEYKGGRSKVTMICDKGHNYKATPRSLLSGKRCNGCSNHGYRNIGESHIYTFYYIEISHNNEKYFEYGKTMRDVKTRYSRYSSDLKKFTDIKVYEFNDYKVPTKLEEYFKEKFKDYHYTGSDNTICLGAKGNTELLTTDVLSEYNIAIYELVKHL